MSMGAIVGCKTWTNFDTFEVLLEKRNCCMKRLIGTSFRLEIDQLQ